jgi:hypothetical protein
VPPPIEFLLEVDGAVEVLHRHRLPPPSHPQRSADSSLALPSWPPEGRLGKEQGCRGEALPGRTALVCGTTLCETAPEAAREDVLKPHYSKG